MRIELEVLKKEPLKSVEYEFNEKILDTDWFLTDDSEREDTVLFVRMSAYFNDGVVFIKGEQLVEFEGLCDRCAEHYKARYSGSFREEIKLAGSESFIKKDPGMINAEEVDGIYLSSNGDFLELKDFFRQMFLASVKLKSLCSNNCKGLCPACGANKNNVECSCNEDNIDFRLIGLKKLKDKLK